MTTKTFIFSFSLLFISLQSFADSTLDAAIGGGIGGALGAAIGNEVGGRDGAIVGGAIGGATGAAITTRDGRNERNYSRQHAHSDYRPPAKNQNKGSFCPPGQKKKGRC
jgi:uncharacterized protein YcfJ